MIAGLIQIPLYRMTRKDRQRIENEIRYELTHCPESLRRFYNYVSNIRPTIWMGLYLVSIPLFALIYHLMPIDYWNVPLQDEIGFGSWLYYSVVIITTLGFGDFTPARGLAQLVTTIEAMTGMILIGFFLNAVGAMRSAIDVHAAIDKERRKHAAMERDKLIKHIPILLRHINRFLAFCYAVTTPRTLRDNPQTHYDPNFKFNDLSDLYEPSGLPFDTSGKDAIDTLLISARETSILLDTLQNRLDMTLWPVLLEDCFSFVANTQLINAQDNILSHPDKLLGCDGTIKCRDAKEKVSAMIASWKGPLHVVEGNPLNPVIDLYMFIKSTADIALRIETVTTRIAASPEYDSRQPEK